MADEEFIKSVDLNKKDLTDNQQTALDFLNEYIATGTTFQKGICLIIKRMAKIMIKEASK